MPTPVTCAASMRRVTVRSISLAVMTVPSSRLTAGVSASNGDAQKIGRRINLTTSIRQRENQEAQRGLLIVFILLESIPFHNTASPTKVSGSGKRSRQQASSHRQEIPYRCPRHGFKDSYLPIDRQKRMQHFS